MRLIDVLHARRQEALKTAAFRDIGVVVDCLEKLAAEKTGGEFTTQALGKIKGLFAGSVGHRISNQAIEQAQMVMHSLSKGIPKGGPALDSAVNAALSSSEKVLAPGAEAAAGHGSDVLKRMDQILKIRSGIAKNEAKLPFLAVAGLLGAEGAMGAGLAMFEKRLIDKTHQENLSSIAGDSQIPTNLKDKAKEMFGVLVTYAPSLAKDKTFSRDFTKNLIRHDTIDHKIVADLISAEKAYKESKGRKAEFLQAIGDLTLKHSGLF